MKKLSKVFAICLAVTLVAGLLSACGSSYNFKAEEAVDNSASQQRWLKYPDSAITINPSAESGEDATDTKKQELSLGVDGKTVDNVLFTLEQMAANGSSGSTEWEADFSAETTKMKNMTKLVSNNSKGSALDVVVPDQYGGKDLDSYNTFRIRGISEAYQYDFVNKQYYLVIETGECADNVDINLYTYSPVYDTLLTSVGSNDVKIVNINELCKNTDEEGLITDSTRAFFDIHFKKGGAYQFKSFSVKVMPTGSQAAESAALEFAPYSLKNTATYPNKTVVETEDFFYSTDTVTRKVTANSTGSFVVGGKIADGATATYDEKDGAIYVDGANGVNYTVRLTKKDNVQFFATEEDMLGGKNALESISGAKYWTTEVSDLNVGDSAYFAVSASTSKKAAELYDNAKSGSSTAKAKKRLKNLPQEWTDYISSHGDVNKYIKNIPSGK